MCNSDSSCSCATTATGTAPAAATAGDVQAIYTVAGMTCGGCASTVKKHLSGVAGVTGVQIDVASGTVTVTSGSSIDTSDVRAAVEQAGYQLVS
jgi:copper chaperone CopZ